PSDAPLALREAVVEAAAPETTTSEITASVETVVAANSASDNLTPDDLIVGGPEHRALLSAALKEATSNVIIHSCFLEPQTVKGLIPELEDAARRRVRVDLLWGLHYDPEEKGGRNVIAETNSVLSGLSANARRFVQLSQQSSGSHAKIIIYNG